MKIKHSSGRLSLAVIAAVLGVQSIAVQAQTQTATNEDLPALIKRIDDLEQQLKILERNREADQQTAADKSKDAASVTLGLNGLIVRSADSNFVMDLHGYAQADARFYLGQKTTPDTFLLRRVRPIVEGTVWKQFDYRLMADLASGNGTSPANNDALLDDAYVNARIDPWFQIQAGKYKSPVGLERLQSAAELNLIETGFATALTPNYDLGASIHNSYFDVPLGYSVGIYNGAIDAGSDDSDTTDEGKDVVARLFAQPFLKTDIAPLKRLGFGVGGSYGDHTGVLPSYKTPGQQTFFAYAPGVTANGEQYRVDPQAYYYWGPFGLLGEAVFSHQTVSSTVAGLPSTAHFDNQAWQVVGSYFLTGEENSFKPSSLRHVIPLHPLDFTGGGWGALELVARVQQLTMDPGAFPGYATATSARAETAWAAGVNWYLNSNVKLNLNYEHTSFRDGSSAAGSATAHDEQVILTRVQFSF